MLYLNPYISNRASMETITFMRTFNFASVLVCTCLFLFAWQLLQRRWNPKLSFSNRHVLITGAASGIGKGIAEKLAQMGASLVLVDIRRDALETVSQAIKDMNPGSQVRHYVCDVSNYDMVAKMADDVKTDLNGGVVSVLINNAGIVIGKRLVELSPEEVRRTMDVNLVSHFWTLKAFLPRMVQHGEGLVVTVSSLMGMLGGASLTDYCASKWGLIGLHESLRLELRSWGQSHNVKTLLVCPYAVNTGMFKGIFEGSGQSFIPTKVFPPLEESQVVSSIVGAMVSGRQFLAIPQVLSLPTLLTRLLPVPIQDWVVELTGGTVGMNHFVGRGNSWNMAK